MRSLTGPIHPMLLDPALAELPFIVAVEPDPWPPIVVHTS